MSKHTLACVNGSTHLAFLEVLKTKMSNPIDVRISFLLSTIITYSFSSEVIIDVPNKSWQFESWKNSN